jgi:hypothetical protein
VFTRFHQAADSIKESKRRKAKEEKEKDEI